MSADVDLAALALVSDRLDELDHPDSLAIAHVGSVNAGRSDETAVGYLLRRLGRVVS